MEHEAKSRAKASSSPDYPNYVRIKSPSPEEKEKDAEQRAIQSVGGDSIWNLLPREAKSNIIKREIEAERQKEEKQKEVELLRSEAIELADKFAEASRREAAQQIAKKEMEKKIEALEALQRHDERVSKTVETVREIISRKDPSRISYYDAGPVERFVGVPLVLDCSCEFDNVEPEPTYHVDGRVKGFRRETINDLIPQMKTMFAEAFSYVPRRRRPIAYFIFQIMNNGRRYASTPAIDVESVRISDSIDTLFDHFHALMKTIKDQGEGYENIITSNNISHTYFHFTVKYYPEPQCIDNWGDDIKPVEKCPLFDIFTANDKDDKCILQCARRIWPVDLNSPDERRHKEATESCIAEFIERANRKVCILQPKPYVKNVFNIIGYSDLLIDSLSPVKKFSILDPEVVFLLNWKGHVGLLENMKEQKRNQFRTSFRPLQKYPKCQRVTVCFDIECYFDPYSKTESTRHIPYLCCACFVYDDKPGNVVEFEGRDCVAQMVDWTAELALEFKHKSIELIAHNGGGYDFHYILSSMYDPGAVKDILIRNNHFISFKFKHMDIQFTVKDSLNFLLCSLSKAAKAFLTSTPQPLCCGVASCPSYEMVEKCDHSHRRNAPCAEHKDISCLLCKHEMATPVLDKTDFPHHEMKTSDDLQKTFQEWIKIDQMVNVDIEKEKMLITSEHIVRYKDNPEIKKMIDWAKEYCCNDVIVLAMVWVKFKQTVADIFNCHVVDQTYTLAGLSFRLFEAHLPHGIYLKHPIKEDFMNMRESLIGGRCISVNGMYKNVACLDVKSLYPAAMAFYDQPYGPYRRVTKRPGGELGIYYVKVTPKSVEHHGFFPLITLATSWLSTSEGSSGRDCQRREVSYAGELDPYHAWYTTVDIDIGIKEGHKIEYVAFDSDGHVGYSWKNKGMIFKEYITNVLYKLKIQYEQTGDKEKRQVIKIIMNSLWGKFAQKWMDTKYKIVNEDNADLAEECYKIWDTDHMLVKKYKKSIYSQKPVQNGVFTLSWARYHMKLLWDAIAKPHQHVTACPAGCQKQHQHVGAVDACGSSCTKKTDAVMLYSDTDSMMVEKDMIKQNAMFNLDGEMIPVIGSDVGQLEIEHNFDEMICVGKKQYMGKYYKNGISNYKFRFKGVPQQYIKPEMYTHLLKDPSHKVQIDFLKFKREWGAVHGYIESKVVTAT